MSKIKFTVHTYSLCISLNETCSYPAHSFVVGPASGMVLYKDLVFYLFVRCHQGAVLLKAGASVSYGHMSFLVIFKIMSKHILTQHIIITITTVTEESKTKTCVYVLE